MDTIYARCPDFVQREVAGECLLVPVRRAQDQANSIYVLNETAAGVWRGLDGKASIGQILETLSAEYEVEGEQLKKDVSVLLDDLLGIKAISAV